MLSNEVTFFDICFIIQIALIILGFYISYNEGRKRGRKEGRRRQRPHKHRYSLPVKDVTPEQFSDIMHILDRSYGKSDIHNIKLTKQRRTNGRHTIR